MRYFTPDVFTETLGLDLTYDARGNLLNIDEGDDSVLEVEYAYTAENELAGAILHDSPDVVIAYGYDADGRRVQADVDGTITNYLWDEYSMYGDVVMEYGATGTPIVDYTLADGQLLAQDRGSVSYYLADAQGSTRALAGSAGTITDTYTFHAFGDLYTSSGSTVNSYLYTGQQFDDLTGLYSLRARYYSPTLGRFLSRDTFPVNYRNPIELNRYGYAANNPINFSDPSGLKLIETGSLNFQAMVRTAPTVAVGSYLVYNNYCRILESVGFNGISRFCAPSFSSISQDLPDVEIPLPDWKVWPDFGGDGDTSDDDVELADTEINLPDVIPNIGGGDGDSSSGGDSGGGGSSRFTKGVIATLITTIVTNIVFNDNSATSLYPQPQQQPVEIKVDETIDTPVDEELPNFIRVRHYSANINGIMDSMRIGGLSRGKPATFYAEYPIATPLDEASLVATYERFGRPSVRLDGVVDFNVDTAKWDVRPDPVFRLNPNINAIEIDLNSRGVSYALDGFPLDEQGVNPVFYDRSGHQLR